MTDGIINIYKEADYTSHDVIARMRGILKTRKLGHTGTLDPDAVGVLPVCVGRATKACDMLTDRSKVYEAVLRLGVTTDTEDMSGAVLSEHPVDVTEEQIIEAVNHFKGDYDQIPPMYSAIKVEGRKLYELAREGIVIERKPRPVTIYELDILKIELPLIHLRISCSKGTYIRSLCRDIGERLGCGGAMEHLTRTRVGEFVIENAITLSQLEEIMREERVEEYIKPVDRLFLEYPKVKVHTKSEHALLTNGNPMAARKLRIDDQYRVDGQWLRLYDLNDNFIALYIYDTEKRRVKPLKMFSNN